jgi:hypothetical protein
MSIVNAIYTALFPSKGALPSLSTGRSLTQCILKITNSKLAIKEIVLMKTLQPNGNNRNRVNGQLLTILLKMRTIQCLETFIPILSNLCSVYPPFLKHSSVSDPLYIFLCIISIPFLEHSISLYNVSDLWQCVALRPRSYKTVLRDHRRMRHVLHSQSCHDFLPCVMHEF